MMDYDLLHTSVSGREKHAAGVDSIHVLLDMCVLEPRSELDLMSIQHSMASTFIEAV